MSPHALWLKEQAPQPSPALQAGRFRRYGITKERFFEMLEQQGWKCPITGEALTESSPIDHCHESGKVRAVLSLRANALLGWLEKNTEFIQVALDYIEKHKKSLIP